MGIFGKLLGGGLGWALGGPIGAVIGVALGHSLDSSGANVQAQRMRRSGPGDFEVSLLVLTAAVMKADGKVLKSELDFVKKFYRQQMNADQLKERMELLRKLLKQDLPLRDICQQIRFNMDHAHRLQLLHYLFGISQADGHVDKSEVSVIQEIANHLGISDKDFESIKAMFYKDSESAYKILEVSTDAPDAEIKKAYRKMALKYHPDRLTGLGEDHQKAAKEKFQKVQDAYELIKKERGFS